MLADLLDVDEINGIAVLQARPGLGAMNRMHKFTKGSGKADVDHKDRIFMGRHLIPPLAVDSGDRRSLSGIERGPLACHMATLDPGAPIIIFATGDTFNTSKTICGGNSCIP